MALERAFTSIAQIPRIIGGRTGSVAAERSEWEPFGEGVVDRLVSRERDLGEDGDGSVDLNKDIREREFLSQCEELLLAEASRWCPDPELKWLEKLNIVSRKFNKLVAESMQKVELYPASLLQERAVDVYLKEWSCAMN